MPMICSAEILAAIRDVPIAHQGSARVKDEELRGLRAFREDYPEAKTLFLYRGKERLKRGGILCMPCEEFLRRLQPGDALDRAVSG